jgi:uridine kinase
MIKTPGGISMEAMFETIKQQIDAVMAKKEFVIVAIDGPCTSGKTTMAAKLAEIYDCNVFHMDDFFLRPEQRTPERFAEAGGNVDYERFREEVLLPLTAHVPFSYRPFDCSTFQLTDPVTVCHKQLNIIEGTYSLHPYFGDVYDLKILLTITPELQRERVLQRPAFLHKRFFEEWIPMENRYFDGFGIPEKCDLVI